MEKEVEQVIADVLELAEDEITDELSPENCFEWDSLATMSILMQLDKKWNMKFTYEEIFAMINVGAIKKIVSEKYGDKEGREGDGLP